MNSNKTAIIINPKSGDGRALSRWEKIRSEAASLLGNIEEFVTQAPRDATRYAESIALNNEFDKLIIFGGDGTLNEAINGLFDKAGNVINPNIKIGMLCSGSGCDVIRSVGIPRNYRDALLGLKKYTIKKCDVGLAVFKDERNQEQNRYFINIAGAGIGGLIISQVNSLIPYVPPKLAYFAVIAKFLLTSKKKKFIVTMDSGDKYEGDCLNIFVANLKFSGAGVCWAPQAKMDDGIFDVVVIGPISKWRIFLAPWKAYNGTLNELPGYHHFKVREVTIESSEKAHLELDGELCGLAPLTCKIVPQAINLMVPA